MIVKLGKDRASTEGTKGTKGMNDIVFSYSEDEFGFWPDRRKKVKFLGIEDDKDLDFLGMLALSIWENTDALEWNRK